MTIDFFIAFWWALVLKLCSIKHLLKLHPHLHPLFNGKPLQWGQKAEQKQFIFISEVGEGVCRTYLSFCGGLPFTFQRHSHLLMVVWRGLHKRKASTNDRKWTVLLVFILLFLQVITTSSSLCGMKAGYSTVLVNTDNNTDNKRLWQSQPKISMSSSWRKISEIKDTERWSLLIQAKPNAKL